jgi:hypothetical protein
MGTINLDGVAASVRRAIGAGLVLGSKRHRRYMNIWLDLASGAACVQPHRAVESAIADGYLAWVASRLEPQSDGVPPLSPALFLAMIQGMYSPLLASQLSQRLP